MPRVVIEVGPTTSRIIGEIDPDYLVPLRHGLSYNNMKYAAAKRFGGDKAKYTRERIFLLTDKRQQFQTGLLHRVIGLCDQLGIEYTINDHRVEQDADHFMPLKLEATMREYQARAIETAIKRKCGMIRMATGGGKTRVMAGIVAQLERKALVLVHRRDLMVQVHDVLNDLMMFPEIIGLVGNGIYEPNLITIATVQTICAALGINYKDDDEDGDDDPKGAQLHADQIRQILNEAQVVVVDEAHHAPARTISEVLKLCKGATWRIGLSATDWRDDGADLLIEAAIGPRIFDVTLSNLIDLGFLVPPEITMLPMMKAPGPRCVSNNWQTIYRHHYVENTAFHRQIFEINEEWYKAGRHILTLVTSLKHGKALEDLHNSLGIETVFLAGADSAARRKEVFDRVRAGKLRHLIGTSIADEGLDLPVLDALNLAAGGKSTTRAYQRIGRVIRAHGNKKSSLVVDYRCYEDEKLKVQAGKRASVYRKEERFQFSEVKRAK